MNWLWVGLAGAFGAMSRYGVGRLVETWAGQPGFVGTLTVNVLGSAALGVVAGLASDALTPALRLAIGVGFLGAFTTFSTFSVDTLNLLKEGRVMMAMGSVSANVALGLLAAWLGMALTASQSS